MKKTTMPHSLNPRVVGYGKILQNQNRKCVPQCDKLLTSTSEKFTRFSHPEPANPSGYLSAVEARVATAAAAGFAARAAGAVAVKLQQQL
jgi:hypothetical protein